MSKTTLAIAAALLAGTTLASAANAEGIRVGFGFPLGSFVAHSNQGYSDAPCRRCGGPDYAPTRRAYVDDQPVRKIKATPTYAKPAPTYAAAPVASTPAIKTAKLEDKLPPATDTAAASNTASSDAATTTTLAKTGSTTVAADTTKTDNVATVAAANSDKDGNPVCRRYSATVGGLVDVPCNQ